jgi:putative thioredoxin
MASDNIIDVTEANFENEVIAYSHQIPVVVDFWATWCAPCRVLGPMLEKLARESQGAFRLAKIDVDQNPNLAERFKVRSIPAVKAFRDGRIITEFTGAIPEPRLRDFVQSFAPGEDNLAIEKGKSFITSGDIKEAETVFRAILEKNPQEPKAKLGLLKSMLLQGKGNESLAIIQNFPASRELSSAEMLKPLALALVDFDLQRSFYDDPLEAAYANCFRLIRRGNLEASMDGLLEILRQNKNYNNGEAKKVFVSMLEFFYDDNPVARQYRNELASILF